MDLPNIINSFGVLFLIIAHITLSLSDKNDRKAFFISGLGGIFVATGSFLIESWPIVFLNVIWTFLSFNKIFNFIRVEKYKIYIDTFYSHLIKVNDPALKGEACKSKPS